MILRIPSPLCGTLLTFVLLFTSSQNGKVLGQSEPTSAELTEPQSLENVEKVDDHGKNEACPCIKTLDCPRPYGTNPLDISEFGRWEPCTQEGFIRCCGVSVSIVQQTEELPSSTEYVYEEEDEDEVEKEESSTEAVGSSSVLPKDEGSPSEEEIVSSSTTPSRDVSQETQGHDREESEVSEESETKELVSDSNDAEDMITAESSQDSQTLAVEGPRKRFPFRRYGRPQEQYEVVTPSAAHSSTSMNSENGENGDNDSDKSSAEESPKIRPSSLFRDRGNRVVYSQRVTDYSAYRPKNNAEAADTSNDSGKNNNAQENNNDSGNGDNAEITPTSTNGEKRPRFPPRKRRPFNSLMRNREQQQQQQEEENKKAPIENENSGNEEISGEIYGPSSDQKSSVQVPAAETVTIQDELVHRRRPMSKLVRPRVNGLNRGRKRPADSGTVKSEQEEENSYSNNSYGVTPTFDNEKDQTEEKLPQQEQLYDSNSEPTIGSVDVSTASDGPLPSSAKVYENTPTGKLTPLRPKIRPFLRKNDDKKVDEDTQSQINPNEDDFSGTVSQANDQISNEEDAPVVIKNNGIRIRKVPIRRIQPVSPEPEVQVEAVTTSSPIKGKIIMRRPSQLVKDSSVSITPESNAESVEESEEIAPVEKLNVRERLRGQRRKNPLKASTSPQIQVSTEPSPSSIENGNEETGKVDNPQESTSSSLLPTSSSERRRPMLRKRIRPVQQSVPSEQGHSTSETKSAEEQAAGSNGAASPGWNQPDADTVKAQQPSVERPQKKIRKGMTRLSYPQSSSNNNNYKEETEKEASSAALPVSQEDNSDSSSATGTEVVKPSTRIRLRAPSQRVNFGTSMNTAKTNGGADAGNKENLDEPQTTSETPVTVTSTYSRIRTNNRHNFPARPVYRKRVKGSGESETATNSPPAALPAEVTSSSSDSYVPVIRGNEAAVKTRFGVPARFPSQRVETGAAQPQPESSSSSPEKELEKQGQSTELSESSQDPNTNGERKRVGFKRRKMVKGKQRPLHQEQDQQQLLSQQEKKQEVPIESAQNYPVTENSEHVATEETVSFQPVTEAYNSVDEHAQEEQNPSQGSDGGAMKESVKITPVDEISHVPETEHHEEDDDHFDQDHDDNVGHKVDVEDDDDDDDNKKADEHDDDEVNEFDEDQKKVISGGNDAVNVDTYDLVLNQDVRKTLGTQYTHPTQEAVMMRPAYESHAPTVETSSAYDNRAQPHPQHNPSDHSNGGGNRGTYHHQQYQYQQPADNQYFDHYYDSYSNHYNNQNLYHSGGMNREQQQVSHPQLNGGSTETEFGGVLELGTPDYEPNPNYQYWHNYDSLEDGEGETRLHMKFLSNKSNANNKLPSSSYSAEQDESVSQNGDGNYNEGTKAHSSLNEEVGPSFPQSTVSPMNSVAQPESTYSRPSSSPSAYNNAGDDNNSHVNKKERNQGIRQKLRRPPSAYINNSADSDELTSTPSVASFKPSLPSPRPTYAGREALVNSVNQSVFSLPKTENPASYPSPQPQFKQNKPVGQRRNRTRVRVKLPSLLTTTTTAVPSYGDNYDDANAQSNANVPGAHHATFTFPPFRKSELALISSPEEEKPDENEAYSYTPPKLVFRSSTTTSTTTPPPTTRKPLKSHSYSHNSSDSYGKPTSVTSPTVGVDKPVKRPSTFSEKYGTRKNRFKVSEMNQVSLSTPSSETPSSSASLPTDKDYSASTRKPQQPRIKTPYNNRRIPTIQSTSAPIHEQLQATAPPSEIYSNEVNPSPSLQEVTPSVSQQQSYEEPDLNAVSIRITSEPTDVITFDTTDEPDQFVRQQAEDVTNGPNSIISSYVPPINNFNGQDSASSGNVDGSSTQKEKFSSRFKVPEKFHQQKPGLSSPSVSDKNKSVGNNINVLPPPQPIPAGDFELNAGKPGSNVMEFGETTPKSPAVFDVTINPISEPQQGPQHQQFQFQSYANGNNAHLNSLDLPQENIPLHQLHAQAALEEENVNDEVIPDIRINVQPVEPFQYQQQQQQQQRQPNVDHDAPDQYYHAIRQSVPPSFPERYTQLSDALKNSPFGPFPSTDHWSGIPTANSPKLPDYLDQNTVTNVPSQQYDDFSGQSHHISFDSLNEVRRPPQSPPSHELRPPPVLPVIENVDEAEGDDEYEEIPREPRPPVDQTSVQFGTQFDGEVEQDRLRPAQRPIHLFNGQPQLPEQQLTNDIRAPEFQQISQEQQPPQHHPNPGNFVNQPQVAGQLVHPHQFQIQISSQHPGQMSLSNGPSPPLPPNNFELKRPNGNQVEIPNNRPTDVNQQQQQSRPPQELPLGAPPPTQMSILPVRYEIKDGEMVPPPFHLRPNQVPQNGPPQQQQIQFPLQPPKQPGFHLQHQKQPEPQQHHHQGPPVRPPHIQPQHTFENPLKSERLRDPALRHNPHANPPKFQDHSNIMVQVDGRPHNAPGMNLLNSHVDPRPHPNNFQKPLERPPAGQIFFDKEPEIRVTAQPPPHARPDNKLPTLNFDGHLVEGIRDSQKLPHSQPQVKFPDVFPQGFGDQQKPLSRPGQFGPPPTNQQNLPHYVPFSISGERQKKNESEKQGDLQHHHQRPVVNRPPPNYQNPGKYGGGQSYGGFPQQPPRQNLNGNFMSPPPPFQHQQKQQQRPPPPHMMPMMRGIPKGQFPNNQHYYQPNAPYNNRPRNPNSRTSRAANLTEDEERDVLEQQGLLASGRSDESKAIEEGELPDQQHERGLKTFNEKYFKEAQSLTDATAEENKEEKAAISQNAPVPAPVESMNIKENSGETASGSARQQRELNLEKELFLQQNKMLRDTASEAVDDDLVASESVRAENFVQDQLPDEVGAITQNQSPSLVKDSTKPVENNDDQMKLSKRKNFSDQKTKPEHIGNEQVDRPSIKSVSAVFSQDKATLNDNKKSILKSKNGKEKIEQQQYQHVSKSKGKSEKVQEKGGIGNSNSEEIQEQQEFVAPTLIQRGFHPILPYSETDPGPILVQMLPKVEKFLPPTNDDSSGVNRPENGASLPIMATSNGNIKAPNGAALSSTSFNHHQDPLLFPNKQLNQAAPSTQNNNLLLHAPANNQASLRSLTHNHLM